MNETILNSTAFKLHRATLLIDRIADEYLQQHHGIRYAPMLVLLMARLLGPTSQQKIAENLGVSRASVSQRVTPLVAEGLLEIEKLDGRTHRVTLTDHGREVFDAAWAGLESHQSPLDDGVDEAALAAQLDRLIANGMALL